MAPVPSTPAPPASDPPVAANDGVRSRLQHLFRDSAASGQLNPLLQIVQRLRLEETQ